VKAGDAAGAGAQAKGGAAIGEGEAVQREMLRRNRDPVRVVLEGKWDRTGCVPERVPFRIAGWIFVNNAKGSVNSGSEPGVIGSRRLTLDYAASGRPHSRWAVRLGRGRDHHTKGARADPFRGSQGGPT
jgi:hypothetical protein